MKTFQKYFLLSVFFLFDLLSSQAALEIKLSEKRSVFSLVKNGNIVEEYRDPLLRNTGVNGNTKSWGTFKKGLDSSQKRGIADENAAKIFFGTMEYKILEEHYRDRIEALSGEKRNDNMQCTTKKGPDNGIDGIFIGKDESFDNPSHVLINESKFRDKSSLSPRDFGFVAKDVQQAHSQWNSDRFSVPTCLPNLDYSKIPVIRTATLLDKNGDLHLYEIRDKGARGSIVGEFASEAHEGWRIRKHLPLWLHP